MPHCYPRGLRFEGSRAEFREQHTYYEQLPGFPGWEQWWQTAQAPAEERASLTSKPTVTGGKRLVLNAAVALGGSIRVEVQDNSNEVIPD